MAGSGRRRRLAAARRARHCCRRRSHAARAIFALPACPLGPNLGPWQDPAGTVADAVRGDLSDPVAIGLGEPEVAVGAGCDAQGAAGGMGYLRRRVVVQLRRQRPDELGDPGSPHIAAHRAPSTFSPTLPLASADGRFGRCSAEPAETQAWRASGFMICAGASSPMLGDEASPNRW